jgi:hypothetical protein
MATTNFQSGTVIASAWLNDVNGVTYNKTFPDGTVALSVAPGTTLDAQFVSYKQGGTGSVSTTVQAKLRESVSVKDFGAVGDGTTDDTAAIQAAINSLTVTAWAGSASGMYVKAGGIVYFPKGVYRITSSLIVGQYVTLQGNTPHGFNYPNPTTSVSNINGSVILADFTNNNSWVIDTAVYNTSTGAPVGYLSSLSGAQTDSGAYNICQGVFVKDLIIWGKQIAYGGIRLSGSPLGGIENVEVYNTDIGILVQNSYGVSVKDILILSNLYGFCSAIDVNGISVDNIWTQPGPNASGRTITNANRPSWVVVSDMGTGVGFPTDLSSMKIGFYFYYAQTVSIRNTISQNWDIGRFYGQCNSLVDNASYHEGLTTYGICGFTVNGSISGVQGSTNPSVTTFYVFGFNCNITLDAVLVGLIYNPNDTFSNIKVLQVKPDAYGWKYYDYVTYIGAPTGFIRVSSGGSTNNIAYDTSYTTIDEALRRIQNSNIDRWVIQIVNGQTVTISALHIIANKNITFESDNLTTPTPANLVVGVSGGAPYYLSVIGNCLLDFDSVNIAFTSSTTPSNAQLTGFIFDSQGEANNITLSFNGSTIALQTAWSIIQQGFASSVNIFSTFNGCTITGSSTAAIMNGAYTNSAHTNVINGQYNTSVSTSIKALGTNGWQNANIIASNF